jgi:HlyD family secretion protein
MSLASVRLPARGLGCFRQLLGPLMTLPLSDREPAKNAQTAPLPVGTPGQTAPQPLPLEPRPPAHRRWRRLVGPFVLLALAVGIGYSIYHRTQTQLAGQAVLPTEVVTRGDLRHTMTITGTISAKESASMIAPQLQRRQGGQLTLVTLPEPGSYVKKGDVVAEFDRVSQLEAIDDGRTALAQAESDLEKTRAAQLIALDTERQAVNNAKANWDKSGLDLKTAEVRSEIEAEKLKLSVQETEADYKQAQEELRLTEISQHAEFRSAEIQRDKAKIALRRVEGNAQGMLMRSPIDGLVVMMPILQRGSGTVTQVTTGDEVSPGTLFMQVVDTSGMTLSGSINQVDSQHFHTGQTAEIRLDAYPGAVFTGRLISVGALATSGSAGGFSRGGRTDYVKRIPVVFSIETRDPRIIPDLTASAQVLLDAQKDVVIAPREGIWEEAAKFFAYVQRGTDAVFTKREVETGASNSTQVAILAGLEPGERIALAKPPEKQ